MIRPSPNELDRLKNEEFAKRRLLRLKEVRECSKQNATRLRQLYKQQKMKVLNKIAFTIQEQLNMEDQKKLEELKVKHTNQVNSVGHGHNNAADWIDPAILIEEKSKIDQATANQRFNVAVDELREEKYQKKLIETARLKAMKLALIIEKERAAEIASLPPVEIPEYIQELANNPDDSAPRVKLCNRNNFAVIESFENAVYNVEKGHEAADAVDAAEARQEEIIRQKTELQIQTEERSIMAHLRGHHALKKQLVHKDYQNLVSDLELISRGEMAQRQRDYHKHELLGVNSAGHSGAGHNVAMHNFKERCRERAVESAVMESLKDITNKARIVAPQEAVASDKFVEVGGSALTRLYDRIRSNNLRQNECQREQENIMLNVSSLESPDISQLSGNDQPSLNISPDIDIETVTCTDTEAVLQNAVSATGRSDIVLHKSDGLKSRILIENDILKLDERLNNVLETHQRHATNLEVIPPSARINNSIHSDTCSDSSVPQSVLIDKSYSSGKASLETRDCDSVSKIRAFQQQAIMKLNGQLNLSQIRNLERQISNFSISNSSSLRSKSAVDSLSCSQYSHIEDSDSESKSNNGSLSIVNAWVKSQLSEPLDKLPEWVTKSHGLLSDLMSDVNVSIKSSILNIKSNASTIISENDVSSTTIASSLSSTNLQIQPSLTEISVLKNISQSEQFLNIANSKEHDYLSDMGLSNDNLSITSSKSAEILQSNYPKEETNYSLSNWDLDYKLVSPAISNSIEDLIDFRSVDQLNVLRNSNQSIHMDTSTVSYHSLYSTPKEMNNSSCTLKLSSMSNSNSFSANNLQSLSYTSELSDQSTVILCHDKSEDAIETNSNKMLKDYELFLNNIIREAESLKSHDDLNDDSNKNQNTSEDCNQTLLPVSETIINSETEYDDLNVVEHTVDSLLTSESVDQLENKVQSSFILTNDVSENFTLENITIQENLENCVMVDNVLVNNKSSSQTLSHTENEKNNKIDSQPTNSASENQSLFPTSSLTLPSIENLDSNESTMLNKIPESAPSPDSSASMKPLSEYCDASVLSCLNEDEIISQPSFTSQKNEKIKQKMRNVLSSTVIPEKINHLPLCPDVSSIYSDASSLLKQRIMREYFEKNKEYLVSALSDKSSELTLKPLDSMENDTPRNPDSGKASSRLTTDRSGESTARMTNEDIFITPRNDEWTDYTTRDEWSSSHSNFRPLSEYRSTKDNDIVTESCETANTNGSNKNSIDNDRTIQCFNNRDSIDLINFNSNTQLDKIIDFGSGKTDYQGLDILSAGLDRQTTPSSQRISSIPNYSPSTYSNKPDENAFSNDISTECNSPYKVLDSFHSSTDSNFDSQTMKQIQKSEILLYPSHGDVLSCSIDSHSDVDISNLSLVSFLKNESICQKFIPKNSEFISESTPKKMVTPKTSIDSNQDMKNQLEKWKKERLLRVNKNPPSDIKKQHLIKDENSRLKEDTEIKSRTLKLWNQLEEVQKMKQIREAEQLKIDNQKRKKQYSERLRQMKAEKQKKIGK